jgi:peptide-methionine (S)-S-oxide reductase
MNPNSHKNDSETATLGGGCFWCLEASFQLIEGVEKVISGYCGGDTENPTYDEVSSGNTGHVEVVQVRFNPKVISYKDVLDIFWAIHNPTTLNQQGNDKGTQYRSAIFYESYGQKKIAEDSKDEVAKLWSQPIVTEIKPLEHFYQAEAYHQNYFNNHPEQAYCQLIINPKLEKLRDKFAARIKQ